ncbi:MAG: cobyrinate a,c-diamide synthase [Sulfolobaceae archaeon]
MKLNRVVISSDRSNSGKTLISSGIMRVISRKMKVRPFKIGPDYIDPGYHRIATGSSSINLDLWLMGEENVKKSLIKYSKGYDISIIEGVMGYYDGIDFRFSTYEVARITKSPVILVIDCKGMSSTVGAIVHGLYTFKNDSLIKGVIFNRIGSDSHYEYCKRSIPAGIKVLGYIPYSKDLTVPSRHLGLITIDDYKTKVEEVISLVSNYVENFVDIDSILEIATSAEEVTEDYLETEEITANNKKIVAIALDSAFSFYYQENIDILKKYFIINFFSPINNEKVDNADFVYIGGGYPELHLDELEKSNSTKKWLKDLSYNSKYIFAECGGLMYLSSSIYSDGKKYNMVNLFDIDISVENPKLTIGYTELFSIKDNIISRSGEKVRGHEFHISKPVRVGKEEFAFKVERGKGIINGFEGVILNNTLATYSHFHFSSIKLRVS